MPNDQAGDPIQRLATRLQLFSTAVAMLVLIGGFMFNMNLQIQRHEWWMQAHQRETEARLDDISKQAQAFDDVVVRVTRMETKIDAMFDELRRVKGGGR